MRRLTDLELLVLEKGTAKCEEIEALLGDYVDGDLTASVRERFEEHLAECEECAQLYDEYMLTIHLARELPDAEVPVEVHNRLRQGLNDKLGLTLKMVEEDSSDLQ